MTRPPFNLDGLRSRSPSGTQRNRRLLASVPAQSEPSCYSNLMQFFIIDRVGGLHFVFEEFVQQLRRHGLACWRQ